MKFSKGQKIKTEEGTFECILCDTEYACFGKVTPKEEGHSVDFEYTFIVSNNKRIDDNFKYELV